MESRIGWIAIALIVAATVLLLTMSARAQEPDRSEVPESSTPQVEDQAAVEAEDATASDESTVLFSTEGTLGGEEPAPPALSTQQLHDGLVAISAGAGWQLPAPLPVDTGDWQVADAGLATMRVPADWVVQNRIGEPGADDQTIGLSPPSNDLYVELRVIRNADSNYQQTLASHANPEYARSVDRLAEGVIFGFQPRMQGVAVGHVEVMNQFGKEIDDDGNKTWRLVLWRGRWEANGEFHRAEFTATLAQDRYEELAPLVNAILGTVAIRASEGGGGRMSTEVDAHALALRYGVALPKPPKLKFELPGFVVGSCNAMLFSPCGNYLVVPTSNGAFLWDVASATKLLKLATPPNPGYFAFSADGGELLVRGHSNGEFARLAIPTGELVARFRPKYPFRLDGTGCLGPGNEHVLQLGCDGMFLMLDATSGKVLLERQLEQTGCSGEVYWMPGMRQVVIAQSSVADWRNRNEPCALWRWTWPLIDSQPERLPGKWAHLTTCLVPAQDALLLHHQADPAPPARYVIDVVDLRDFKAIRRIECGGTSIPRPVLSHDGRAWAVTTWGTLQVGIDDERVDLPIRLGSADFSPTHDLVAISGPVGVVVPRGELAGLRASLQLYQDEGALNLRGYARGTTWPGRVLPPRFVVYAGPDGFGFEVEAIAGRKYVPTDTVIRVAADADVLAALAAAMATARQSSIPGTDRDRRDFQVGPVRPPAGAWTNAVAVTLASDAIDLWPMKAGKDGGFKLHWYPVAAIPAGTLGADLWTAIEAMLGKLRKAKTQA